MVILLATLSGCVASDAGDDQTAEGSAPDPDPAVTQFLDQLAASRDLVFDTDHGTIRLLLYDELMPRTAGRFGALVDSGFYDGTIIHRVVDDFVIQGGDPSGTGQMGSGETIPHEIHPELLYAHGAMGMARDLDPDSGDSQWFITEKPQPHLSAPSGTTGAVFGAYALYGQVYEGMDIVRSIASVPVVPGADRPIDDVTLQTARLAPPPAIDLLTMPPTLATTSGTSFTIDLVTPLHLFATHTFPVTVFLEATDADAALPTELHLTLSNDGANRTITLHPLSDDASVYTGQARLDSAAEWTLTVTAGSDTIDTTRTVHPWHPAYADYDRRATT